MNCKEINELLAAYFDGEVIPEEREQIQAHLSACPHCREELEALAATQENLRRALKVTAAGVSPSPQAWVSLRQRLEAEEKSRGAILGLAKSRVRVSIDTITRGLVSRQPIWKTAVAGILALALVIGLSLTIPSLTKQSPEALAASIARNSPEVQAALDGEEIEEVEVTTKVVDDEGNVLMVLVKTERRAVATRVNLDTKQVTEIVRVHVPEFEEGDEQKALDIAKADPRVQELLAQGGVVVKEVHLGYSVDIAQVTGPDGVTRKEGTAKPTAFVSIDLKGKAWSVAVDLDEERVMGIGKPSAATLVASMSHLIFSIITPFVVAIGVLIILGLALRNRLAVKIAGIASIVFGIIGLFGGLYAQLPTAWNQALLFGIPIIGLVIGIVEIRRRATKRWMAIAGVVICSIALVWDLVSIIAYLLAGR